MSAVTAVAESTGYAVNKFLKRHGNAISIALGVGTLLWAGVDAAMNSTPKALELLHEEVVNETDCDMHLNVRNLPAIVGPKKTVAITWKCYIRPVIEAAAGVTMIVIGVKGMRKEFTSLFAAYNLVDRQYRDCWANVQSVLTDKQTKAIEQSTANEAVQKAPQVDLVESSSKQLCLDHLTGRWFYSTENDIYRAINELNREINQQTFVNLNSFYDALNLNHNEIGNDLGWNPDMGLVEPMIDVAKIDGKDCLVVGFYNPPRWDYQNYYG